MSNSSTMVSSECAQAPGIYFIIKFIFSIISASLMGPKFPVALTSSKNFSRGILINVRDVVNGKLDRGLDIQFFYGPYRSNFAVVHWIVLPFVCY